MSDLLTRVEFWIAMIFAVAVKLRASPTLTRWEALSTTIAAIAGALTFTAPAVAYLGLSPETWQIPAAALVALTCEHGARLLLQLTAKDILSIWRGRP